MSGAPHYEAGLSEHNGVKYLVSTTPADDGWYRAGYTVPRQGEMKGEIRVRLRERFESGGVASRGAHLAAKIDIERILRG